MHLAQYLIFLLANVFHHAHGRSCTPESEELTWQTAPDSGHSPESMPGKVTYGCRNPSAEVEDELLGIEGQDEDDVSMTNQEEENDLLTDQEDSESQPPSLLRPRQAPKPKPGYCNREKTGKKPVQSTTVEGTILMLKFHIVPAD